MSENFLLDIFTRWRNPLMRQAKRYLTSEQDAEDVLQDVFVSLWTKHSAMDSEAEAKALATVAVRNRAIDKYREAQRLTIVEIDNAIDETNDSNDGDKEREALVEKIMTQSLTPIQRQIVQMREFDGQTYEQIASKLSMSQVAVRMQLSRARKAICNEYRKINQSL